MDGSDIENLQGNNNNNVSYFDIPTYCWIDIEVADVVHVQFNRW